MRSRVGECSTDGRTTARKRWWAAGPIAVLAAALLWGPVLKVSGAETADNAIRVVSWNLRYGTARDGENRWELRDQAVAEQLHRLDPDLLGTQETLQFQADFVAQQLPSLAYVGRSRQVDPKEGEQTSIFYRRDRFELLDSGHFWLSQTPHVVASRDWDAALPRMASWVRLTDRSSGVTLVYLNTHFDHVGQQARLEAAGVIRAFLERQNPEDRLIVTGDFNAAADSEPYQRLAGWERLVDTYRKVQPESTELEGTFNGWENRRDGARIDWILVSPEWRVFGAGIDRDSQRPVYPSDHFAVFAKLGLEK